MPETTRQNDDGGAGSVPVFDESIGCWAVSDMERRSKKVWSGDVWSGE